MGLYPMKTNPIPHLTSPLKGEEQDKLALMRIIGLTFHLIEVSEAP